MRISVCLLLLAIAVPGFAKGPPTSTASVVVAQVEARTVSPINRYPGTVISKNDAQLAAEVSGRLEWVAQVGAKVGSGEIVAKIDNTLLTHDYAREQAMIASEKARLTFFTKEVERLQRLVAKGNAADNLLDQAVSDRLVTKSNLDAARARSAQIKERIERSQLRAPFAGLVSERFLQAGEWAESGQQVVRLVDIESIEISTRIPQFLLALVQRNDQIQIESGGTLVTATVTAIVPVGSNQSRLYELRLQPAKSLSVGALVNVLVPTSRVKQTLTVPRDALVIRRDSISVFRINEKQIAEQITVQPGIANGDYIEVTGPLNIGDRVVTRGGERLRPGQTVSIIPSAAGS